MRRALTAASILIGLAVVGAPAMAAGSSGHGAQPRLVRWTGPVEHLFFHPLVPPPYRAFHGVQAQGFKDYYVTSGEFRRILEGLYRRRWVLVDIHRAVSGQLRVPAGTRPLVLSIDDLNYYDHMRIGGLGWRLVLDRHRRIAVEYHDPRGRVRVSGRLEIVPILDDFVLRHPAFSVAGAKGVIAETGFQGVLGERTDERAAPDWSRRVARARRLVRRLKATGWTFASHSFGHIDLSRSSAGAATADADRWLREVEPIVGPTDVLIYAFGAVPSNAVRALLHTRFGFRIFCSIDVIPATIRTEGVTVMYYVG